MTQEQLNHIYVDICAHGKHVEGWSCDELGGGLVLQDNKRQTVWERTASETLWVERITRTG